jgi:hypothetical protein
MIPPFFIKVFDCVAQSYTRHPFSMSVLEVQQWLAILFASLAQNPTNSCMDKVMVIIQEDF